MTTAPPPVRSISPALLATLVTGTVLNPINSSLIATALTPIGRSLHVGAAQTAWLVASLYLIAAVAQPLMGRLADLIGPRRVFLAGLVVAGTGGVIGGLGPGLGWLILSRLLIGIGTSAGYPSAITVLSRLARQTGQPTPRSVLGAISIAGQVIAVIGPTLGGLLVGALGWRAVFWINVPVTLIGLAMAFTQLPRDEGRPRAAELARRLDLPGVALFALGLTALLLFLMNLRAAPPVWALVLAVVAFTGLGLVEWRRSDAFIDLRMLGRNTPLLMTYVRTLLIALILYSVFYGMPQWLQEARGFIPAQAGLIMLPISLMSIVVTLLASRTARLSVRGMLVIGSVLLVFAVLLIGALPRVPALPLMVAATLLFGLPWGLNNLANQQGLTIQAPPQGAGSAAGLFRTASYLGSILSSSVISFTFQPSATSAGFETLSWVLLGSSLLLLLITLGSAGGVRTPRDPKAPQTSPDTAQETPHDRPLRSTEVHR